MAPWKTMLSTSIIVAGRVYIYIYIPGPSRGVQCRSLSSVGASIGDPFEGAEPFEGAVPRVYGDLFEIARVRQIVAEAVAPRASTTAATAPELRTVC